MTGLTVVLGASGFVGTAVTRALSRRGDRLRLVARRPWLPDLPGPGEAEVVLRDLLAPGAVADVVTDATAVVHLVAHVEGDAGWRAAPGDSAALGKNQWVMEELLRAAGRAAAPPVVLFASTVPTVLGPRTPYELQKRAAELALERTARAGLVRGASLRLPTVFGPPGAVGESHGVVAAMARRALRGEELTLWHDGTVRRDLLHVADAAGAFLAALETADACRGLPWDVSGGAVRPLGELAAMVAEAAAAVTGRPPVPVRQVAPPAYATEVDFAHVAPDGEPFRRVTGWRPRHRLADAVRATVESLVDEMTTKG